MQYESLFWLCLLLGIITGAIGLVIRDGIYKVYFEITALMLYLLAALTLMQITFICIRTGQW